MFEPDKKTDGKEKSGTISGLEIVFSENITLPERNTLISGLLDLLQADNPDSLIQISKIEDRGCMRCIAFGERLTVGQETKDFLEKGIR